MSRPLTHRERVAWLRLARTPGIGPLTFHNLLRKHHGAEAALEALPRIAPGRTLPSAAEIERELASADQLGARMVASCEPDYPPLLAQLDPVPPVLCMRGRLDLPKGRLVAIVGARDASAAGLRLAEDFARELGRMGFVIVSGLARGLDARAHEASLASGTIAVLAGGLDRPYPPQNLKLYDQICAEGLAVTEAPLGFQARARDFPRRNHVISGMSLGVVVIEAAQRSGSLITARAAAEQGRDVMAVPGSPLDPRARGCNALLKQGATLVETPEDVAEALRAPPERIHPLRPPLLGEPNEQAPDGLKGRVLGLLSPTPVHLNDLARFLDAPMGAVAAALMELELADLAASLPGGYAALSSAAFPSDR